MAEACLTPNSEVSKFKSSFTQEDHPLLKTSVISKILSFLDASCLKQCRLICKLWNLCALSLIALKTKFNPRGISKRQIDDYVIAIKKGLCAPPMNFMYSFGASLKTCEKFIKFYGDRIKSLELNEWDDTNSTNVFQTHRYHLSTVLLAPSCLQSLCLNSLPDSIASKKSLFPRSLPRHPPLMFMQKLELEGLSRYSFGFLSDLLFAMPNVKEIVVNEAKEKFLTTLMKVLNTHNFRHLVSLEIESPSALTNNHIYKLRNSGLKLKKLLLIDDFCKVGLIPLQTLLHELHSSLEELHLPVCRHDIEDDRAIMKNLAIPRMEVLKKLKVADWNLVGPISFALNLPSLDTLDIKVPRTLPENYEVFPIDSDSQSTIELKTHTILRELDLPMIIITPTELQKILLRFPMLEKLTIRLDEESAYILWENGSCLKSLTIDYFSKLNDSSITGITIKPDNIYKLMIWNSDAANYALADNLRTKKYIGDLKNLQYLSITKFDGELTDLSIFHGIASLKNLTSLSLNSARITGLSLREIMKKLKLFHLDLTWSPGKPICVGYNFLEELKHSNPFLHFEYSPKDRSRFINLILIPL